MDILLAAVIILGVLMFVLSVRDYSFHIVRKLWKKSAVIILPVGEDNGEIELAARDMLKGIERCALPVSKIILLDMGMTEEEKEICTRLCKENPIMEVSDRERMSKYFT